MYEAIKQSIMDEAYPTNTPMSIDEAYESLYHTTSRLSDMDDFSTDTLKNIYKTMGDDFSDESFVKAFNQVIEDSDYYKDALTTYKSELNQALQKAIKNANTQRSWNADIYWLFNHATVNIDGTDYTLKQLQTLLDKEEYENEYGL